MKISLFLNGRLNGCCILKEEIEFERLLRERERENCIVPNVEESAKLKFRVDDGILSKKRVFSLKEYCHGVVAGVVRRYESNYHFPSRVRPASDKKCAG